MVYTERIKLPSLAAIFPITRSFQKLEQKARGPADVAAGNAPSISTWVAITTVHVPSVHIPILVHPIFSYLIYPAHSPGPCPLYYLPLGTDLRTAKTLVSVYKQSLQDLSLFSPSVVSSPVTLLAVLQR